MRQTFSSDNEDHLVGLEKNVEQLVVYLVDKDSSQVVSITGMGGIGKTTLARQVFNNETVRSHFPGLAWVCVSQQFTRKYIWQTILRKLGPEYKVSEMLDDELQEKLVQVLKIKKVLIVLDDIWREEDWDIIKPMFPREKGWKVLLTSRNEGVALRADPNFFTFKPACLSLEECWTIFRRIVFPRENSTEYKVDASMEEIGKQMIKHCRGLPLAVKVLGGLLATQYTLQEWKRIYENIRSHIVGGTSFNDRNLSSVYHILYMSFDELPIYLKHCFLYLAHFPEDYKIDVGQLSYYWAAEAIPTPRNDGATIREVGDGCIAELVKRNMVVSERDVTSSRFETCHLHDMMREVCLRKAEEENYVQIFDPTSMSTANPLSFGKCRRLAVHQDKTFHLMWENTYLKLRSLLFVKEFISVDKMIPRLNFKRLLLMRVLDLSGAILEGEKLPSNIGELIHLRYLSLHGVRVTVLPSSIRNLRSLLYLNLNVRIFSSQGVYMSDFLKELRELRYLSLPRRIQDGTKLELGNLINLERLACFSTKNSSVTDLHRMTKLRGLSVIIDGEDCTLETLVSSLRELRHLENLNII